MDLDPPEGELAEKPTCFARQTAPSLRAATRTGSSWTRGQAGHSQFPTRSPQPSSWCRPASSLTTERRLEHTKSSSATRRTRRTA
jgi:hypothetical protein